MAMNSPGQKKRILVVDDHPVVRRGLMEVLDQDSELAVCGEADDSIGTLRQIEQQRPDAVLVDLTLKDCSGIELTKMIKSQYPSLPVLVLSFHTEGIYVERALRAGAKAYVTKDEPPDKLILAIKRCLNERVYISEEIAGQMLSKFVGGHATTNGCPVDCLTDRELEVFEYIGQGLTTRQISLKLHRSAKTIDSHCANIKSKLKLLNARDLLQHAIEWVQYQRAA